MKAVVTAAFVYFAAAFAAGFALGAIREIFVVPRLGGLAAVAIEVPIMLAISWIAARTIVARFAVPTDLVPRLVMGGLAFVLLQVAEMALAAGFGMSPAAYLTGLATPPGILGFAAQAVFALFPAVVGRDAPRR